MYHSIEPREAIESLTGKQREVMDLLLHHNTTKQIARELGISPSTVDQRIMAVREKWGTIDRNETARLYGHFLEICGKSPCGFSQVEPFPPARPQDYGDLPRSPQFEIADVSPPGRLNSPWFEPDRSRWALEAFDARFGKKGRVMLIIALAFALAATLLLSLSIAAAIDHLL